MGSSWDASAGGADADPGGEPDPDDLELVVELIDDEALPEDGPNAATSDRETIGADGDGAGAVARIRQLPRAVRALGVLAVATVLAFVVWPTAGRQEAVPPPIPSPSHVNVDLYKVRLGATTLHADDGADHAVLGLELTNNAATRLEVVSAELWDAVGTRIGSAAIWPAEGLSAQSTESVPVTLPYACDTYEFLPVLPLTVRYSISTPQNPNVRHDYAAPLTGEIWDTYMRQRAAQCSTPDAEVSASAIDMSQPIGEPGDPQGFDLTFTIEAAGTATWGVQKVDAIDPAVSVTGTGLPVTVSPGQTAHVTTHWHLLSCGRRPGGTADMSSVEFTARVTDPPPGSGAAQEVFVAELRPGLVQELLFLACGD